MLAKILNVTKIRIKFKKYMLFRYGLLAPKKMRQENHRFKARLDYIVRPCLKNKILDRAKMTQLLKAHAAKPADLRPIPSTWWKERTPIRCPLAFTHAPWHRPSSSTPKQTKCKKDTGYRKISV